MRNMSRWLMALWGVVIILILTAIYIIGYNIKNKEKDEEYIKLESSLKTATYSYLNKNNMVPGFNESQIVFIEDLIKDEYVKNEEEINKYCVKSIVFTNGLLKDDYNIIKECEIDN